MHGYINNLTIVWLGLQNDFYIVQIDLEHYVNGQVIVLYEPYQINYSSTTKDPSDH